MTYKEEIINYIPCYKKLDAVFYSKEYYPDNLFRKSVLAFSIIRITNDGDVWLILRPQALEELDTISDTGDETNFLGFDDGTVSREEWLEEVKNYEQKIKEKKSK